MIELKLIPADPSELHALISDAYAGDEELIEFYQAGERTFEECVDFNYHEICERHDDPATYGKVEIWRIAIVNVGIVHTIGYCVTIKKEGNINWLFSYAINIAYRKAPFLIDWLLAVDEELEEPYLTALWAKNTRAMEFFKKNNFVEKPSPDGTFKYFFKGYEKIPQKQLEQWQLV